MIFKATIRNNDGIVQTLARSDVTDMTLQFPTLHRLMWENITKWITSRADEIEIAWSEDECGLLFDEMRSASGKHEFSALVDRIALSPYVWGLVRYISIDGVMSLTFTFDASYVRCLVESSLDPKFGIIPNIGIKSPSAVSVSVDDLIKAGVSERDLIAVASDAEQLRQHVIDLRVITMPADRAIVNARHDELCDRLSLKVDE